MNDKARKSGGQLEELIERIKRLEAKAGITDQESCRGHGGDTSDNAFRLCSLPRVPERTFAADVSLDRQRLIAVLGKKFVNGTKLRYYFFKDGPWTGANDQIAIVREAFEVWKNVGIGISFQEINDISEAEIRIGFLDGDGAWSYIGRDVIDVPGQGERTMNFGWDLNEDPRREFVAVHEIGHTLGFPHEHQNPNAGIVWDEERVYATFGAPPNSWDRATTFHNILSKLPASEVQGTNWDPDSIMHYGFPAGLILQPEKYRTQPLRPAGGLSSHDLEQVRQFYPPIAAPSTYPELRAFRSEPLSLSPGQQKNFAINPTATRTYAIQTFGNSDTVMVLFEEQNGDLKYVDGDDDSGTSLNARVTVRLYQGRKYVLRIRLYSNNSAGDSAVMMW